MFFFKNPVSGQRSGRKQAQKNPCRRSGSKRGRALSLVLAGLLPAGLLLGGCAGTGTMFTPETSNEGVTYYYSADGSVHTAPIEGADTGLSNDSGEAGSMGSEALTGTGEGQDPAGSTSPGSQTPDMEPGGADAGQADGTGRHDRRANGTGRRGTGSDGTGDEPVEKRRKSVSVEGTGSDLYMAQTVDYYYGFTLEGVSFDLPCSVSSFLQKGWELQLPQAAEDQPEAGESIPPYSFEFYDAIPAWGSTGDDSFFSSDNSAPAAVRLCIANFHSSPRTPSTCTLCGISVSLDSGLSLQTCFGSGLGDTLDSLTDAFGTDGSIYTRTAYDDGKQTATYRFANGLNEGESISVLAEAEEKSLADLLYAETGEDGSTIDSLSLYYFKLP